jgi:pyruvate formate lyase activating enzyme
MEAKFYSTIDGQVHCSLCPHRCHIAEGKKGICQVRKNEGGVLYSLNYGVVSAMALDPIEKKPLYHFHPGSYIFSIGSVGCNFRCLFCQNYNIAQVKGNGWHETFPNASPQAIFQKALDAVEQGSIGVAYTYNEPTVWYEYMYNVAEKVKEAGLVNVMVSNGYIEAIPLDYLLPLIDAFNIDLKGYSNSFYKRMLGGTIEPVRHTLKAIVDAGKHMEITYLVIPFENDSPLRFREVVQWISEILGPNTVLHINRYFPSYLLDTPATSMKSLLELYAIAKDYLSNVYVGNTGLAEHNNTYCTKCGKLVVERHGMHGNPIGLTSDGRCSGCNNPVM